MPFPKTTNHAQRKAHNARKRNRGRPAKPTKGKKLSNVDVSRYKEIDRRNPPKTFKMTKQEREIVQQVTPDGEFQMRENVLGDAVGQYPIIPLWEKPDVLETLKQVLTNHLPKFYSIATGENHTQNPETHEGLNSRDG